MNNKEVKDRALQLIANNFIEAFSLMIGADDELSDFKNITELKEYVYDGNSNDMKEDIWYCLTRNNDVKDYVSDDCSLNLDNELISYRKLMNMFKKAYLDKE